MQQVEAVSHYSGASLQKGWKKEGLSLKSYRWSHLENGKIAIEHAQIQGITAM
jgi:hypothetical protein